MTVTLHLGDCLQIMPTLPAGSIDAIITDVPYGATACAWDTVIPFVPMWECVKRVLKPNGVFVTTASQPFTSMLVVSNLKWFKYEWIWNKNMVTGFATAKYRPMLSHENITVFSKSPHVFNPIKRITESSESIRNAQNGTMKRRHKGLEKSIHDHGMARPEAMPYKEFVNPRTSLFFDTPARRNGSFHPTQKPVALYKYLILTYTNPGDTVLDICAGSGTTGVACIETGRNFIGNELKQEYYEIMEKRIKQAQLQMLLPIQV